MKSTKNWSKGFSKNLLLAALAALVLTFGLVVVGCADSNDDDGGDKGKTVTFTLEKVDATSFTITVDGAKWNKDIEYVPGMIMGNDFKADSQNAQPGSVFEFDKTSDTEIKATLKEGYTTIAGPINFQDVNASGPNVTDGGYSLQYQGGSTTYVDGTPGCKITF
jgi:hypothetical protein